MDKFLAGLPHFAALTAICRQERHYGDPILGRKYTQGQIVTVLTMFLQALGKHDDVPLPPKSPLLPPGCLLSAKPVTFSCQRPVSVNALHVAFDDGSSINIPPDINGDDRHIAQCYTAAINAIQADPRKFDLSSECAVCGGTGHPFIDCMALNDIYFLRKHHIAYCVKQWRLKKMMTTRVAVNTLGAALTNQASPDQDFCPGEIVKTEYVSIV